MASTPVVTPVSDDDSFSARFAPVPFDDFFDDLRRALATLSANYKRAKAAGDGEGQRQAAFYALLETRNALHSVEGFRDVLQPLDAMIVATTNLERGHRAAILSPHKTAGAPKSALWRDHVRVSAVAAVTLAQGTGFPEAKARQLVVAEFKRAGVRGMVGASGLKEWRSRIGSHRRLDHNISKRIEHLVAEIGKLDPKPSGDELSPAKVEVWKKQVSFRIRQLAKHAADLSALEN